ncbi:CRISPR system precrRNA processing endoribonuclease RAMP protein Cas6 [Anaerolentibacter hominis]|uniref:CRISPR system precrRNA processing endoribonuclease RAMP protein Cas6 n=1 Tax=Anaerolentibacter hominis TaxID=3079009 RepID=UPI0031B85A9F
MFDFMKITTLEAVFTAQASGRLPGYLGSTIRGILGHCFRDFVCDFPSVKCCECRERSGCLYVRSFANTGGVGGAINPFVLYACTQGKTEWKKGDECVFQMTLFGYAAEHPEIYMDAIFSMQERGWGVERIPFKLNCVTDWERGSILYAGGRSWLRNLSPHTMSIRQVKTRHVLIYFTTPVRIITGRKLFTSLTFQEFLHFLMRRFMLVTQVCTDFTMEWEQDEMLQKAALVRTAAEHWDKVDFTRYSMNSVNGKLELAAQSGWALYEGDLTAFVPYLEAGRYLHVGRNSTIGFGKYELYYDGEATL